MIQKFFPKTEKFLSNVVCEDEYFDYIWHGFILATTDHGEFYVSACLTKKMIWLQRTPELDAIMNQKCANESNLCGLTKLKAKFASIRAHFSKEEAVERVRKELEKEEHKSNLANFEKTILYLVSIMFKV